MKYGLITQMVPLFSLHFSNPTVSCTSIPSINLAVFLRDDKPRNVPKPRKKKNQPRSRRQSKQKKKPRRRQRIQGRKGRRRTFVLKHNRRG